MSKKKIMIVDDDKEFLQELKETLNLNNYDVATFSDGTSALGMISRIQPDVVLLDLKLRGKSGFQIAYELKRFPETVNIPIIAMTAYYTEKQHAELMNLCGIQTYLIKPFNLLDAIAKIETVLEQRRR